MKAKGHNPHGFLQTRIAPRLIFVVRLLRSMMYLEKHEMLEQILLRAAR